VENKVLIRAGQMELAQWCKIYSGASFRLDSEAKKDVERSAAVVQDIIESGKAIYAVNTGFGKLADRRIETSDLELLQRKLILSHSAGTGPALAPEIVRLIMALKVGSLARGASGVRWQLLEKVIEFSDKDLIAFVPAYGSVGASGDLAPLAHLTAPLLGAGMLLRNGSASPAAEILTQKGVKPISLAPKEGVAMINGTQVSTALLLSALFKLDGVLRAALIAGALSVDAAKASDIPFDSRIHNMRGQRGQLAVARTLVLLLEKSEIRKSHQDCERVQDPYSLRCQPQVIGACLDIAWQAARVAEIEANAVTDNPLVFSEPADVLSGGNFHAEPIAMAADILALSIAEIGALSERRIALLMDTSISGLPPFLAVEPGLNSGYMMAQVTAAALASENKRLAHPASVDSIPTSANQEDHVSMATQAAYRTLAMIENTTTIVAIELLASIQGLDFHRPLKSSPVLQAVRNLVREHVPTLDEDREITPDINSVRALIQDGEFDQFIEPGVMPSILRFE